METLVAWGLQVVHARNKQIVLRNKILDLFWVYYKTQNETESKSMYKTNAFQSL